MMASTMQVASDSMMVLLAKKSSGSPSSTSLASIIATLIPTSVTAITFIVIFATIRLKYRLIYAPRTFLGTIPEQDRTPSSSTGRRKWLHDFRALEDKFVLRHQSLDGYLFLRFFKLIILICAVGVCITWPILLPVNATGGGDATELDRFTFSNIDDNKRLYAHAVVAWLFLGFIVALVTRENLFLIGTQRAYFASRASASRLSSRVVLFLSAPKKALQTDDLKEFYGKDAEKAWVVPDPGDLGDLVQSRDDTALELENAEFALTREGTKRHRAENSSGNDGGSSEVPDSQRPRKRAIPFVRGTSDIVDQARKSLPNLQSQVQELREKRKESAEPLKSAVFVAFSSPAAAQRAALEIELHPILSKISRDRFLAVKPKDAVWANLTLTHAERVSRQTLGTILVVMVILFWAIPIGFIGAATNMRYLADNVSFLHFLNELPASWIGIISGFLPPLLISTLVSYVPKIFRYTAKLAGEPTTPQAELMVQNWFFIFQVIQVFLVTTLSSGAAAVAGTIAQDPASTPALLAKHLPQASNFYLAYILFQGTASAAKNLLNYSDLLEYLFCDKFIDKTPRDKYTRFTYMKNCAWGSVYPKFTNLTVIAIAYSCIAPVILGFAAVGLFFFYLSYRYNLLYVLQPKVDSRGECYRKALQHLFTGVYLAELCLFGLFGAREAPGPSAMMLVLFILTIVYHAFLNRILSSLNDHFSVNQEGETVPLLADEEGTQDADYTPTPKSRAETIGLAWLPTTISEPIARLLESQITQKHDLIKSWLNDPSTRHDENEETHYSQAEVEKAYLNPLLTSKTPKIWLAKDEAGVSKEELGKNQEAGIEGSDEGAELNARGDLHWSHDDFEKVPIFKKPVQY